jgi:AAA15 family ATPase/GTPase
LKPESPGHARQRDPAPKLEDPKLENSKKASASLSRRVFISGPNASGRSNFLDAFRFLRDVAGDGLHQAVGEM